MNGKETKEYRRKYVNAYKLSMGCQDCKRKDFTNPAVLCFDHLDGYIKHDAVKNGYSKRPSAGGMYRLYDKKYDFSILIEEIKKCRILCQNCHMSRTHSKYQMGNFSKIHTIEELEKKLCLS